jgi:hypothetical protein
MAAPTLVFSETNGAGPSGTTTDNITTINFASADLASNTASILTNNPVAAGTNSYEKWFRMKVTGAATNSLSAFSIYFSATAPTDGAGSAATLTMKFGVNGAYATPVATASTVATTACSTVTSAPGTTFTAPANSVGSYSGYFTQQLIVASNATGGNVTFPASWATVQYTYS